MNNKNLRIRRLVSLAKTKGAACEPPFDIIEPCSYCSKKNLVLYAIHLII